MNLLLLFVVLLSAAGQVLVKAGADRTLPGEEPSSGLPGRAAAFLRRAANPYLLGGALCVAAVPLLYTRALASMPLSRAYGATGLTYPLVMIAGALFLREKISLRHAAGALLIVAGFFVWNGAP